MAGSVSVRRRRITGWAAINVAQIPGAIAEILSRFITRSVSWACRGVNATRRRICWSAIAPAPSFSESRSLT